jgi:beta-glucosidase/6-phospho-beta-glucosidase/beta-galactosidase
MVASMEMRRWDHLGLLLAFCAGCSSTPNAPPIAFPPGFLWGVSTAAEQSEGGNTGNDWYAFEGMGRVPPVGLADDMYDLYDTDSANAQAIGANAFRLTFEWARLMPQAPQNPASPTEADLDPTAVAHYQAVLASLKAHGLTPIVTLTHYTLPIWIDNPASYDAGSNVFTDGSPGGWLSASTATAFAGFAGLMAQEFGSQVTYWITENEPEVDLIGGYLGGVFPPGLSDLSLTAQSLPGDAGLADVLQNMISGHAQAYKAIKAIEPNAKVSIAHNSITFEPQTNSTADTGVTQRVQFLYDFLFLDSVTTGQFDQSLVGLGPTVSHPEWANTLDYIGVNYYAHDVVIYSQGLLSPLDGLPCDPAIAGAAGGLLSDLGCPAENPPEQPGFTAIVSTYQQRYGLPILVTENGANASDPNAKAAYLVQNLLALHDAMDAGANVIGYSYWTLNEDYEWASGYYQAFGLFGMPGFLGADGGILELSDGGTWAPSAGTDFTRSPHHPATDVYLEIADSGVISPALVAQYAADGG